MKYEIGQYHQINQKFGKFEKGLADAIERNELILHYQPRLSLLSGKIVGTEALIRWKHPERGIIWPDEFIPIAENTGLIIPIGEWVLRTACLQNKKWQDLGYAPMVISVNLSVRQLYQPNLVEMVKKILAETDLAPEFLEIEVTESMLMDIQHCIKVLQELKGIGIQISLDDFGTGYSSLLYLKELPINKLKIDRSFIKNCTQDAKDATIVKTIIAMAHQLELAVVAEGVETKDHMVFLQRHLCNETQGYLFSQPLPPEQISQRYDDIEQIITQRWISKELPDQKWLEEELYLARRELAEMIRQQQGMIFKIIKKDGKFIHTICDGELLYRLGLTPEEIVGRELAEFLPANNAEEKTRYYEQAWKGAEHVTYEGVVNGVYYIASLRPIYRNGQVTAIIGSCVDITDGKKAKEALKLSECKYHLITENMTDLVSICDLEGRIIYASISHRKVLGFLPEGDYENLYSWLHLDDIPHIQKQFKHLIRSKRSTQIEFRVKHRTGRWIDIEAQFTPVIGEGGEIDHIVVVGRDISERKRAEEAMRRTETLSVAGHLAAGIAHEVRNPLTTIKGFLQIMQQESEKQAYFDIMLSEINHVERKMKELLLLAKPQASKAMKINIKELLQQVIPLFRKQVILKSIAIAEQIDPKLPYIYCDQYQIKQVFISVLQNAVEAMEHGGVITIQAASDHSENVKLRFIDQGCGISNERLSSIYGPFYSIKEKGIGISLMICRKIIEEHGGTIDISSKAGQGTAVDIVLPIKLPANTKVVSLF